MLGHKKWGACGWDSNFLSSLGYHTYNHSHTFHTSCVTCLSTKFVENIFCFISCYVGASNEGFGDEIKFVLLGASNWYITWKTKINSSQFKLYTFTLFFVHSNSYNWNFAFNTCVKFMKFVHELNLIFYNWWLVLIQWISYSDLFLIFWCDFIKNFQEWFLSQLFIVLSFRNFVEIDFVLQNWNVLLTKIFSYLFFRN